MPLTQDAEIRRVLEEAKTIAVVGYSTRPMRPSHEIAHMLKAVGYDVYLVNPTVASTSEEVIYPQLADVPVPIDIVDVFRRADAVPDVVEAAIAAKAKLVWMQLGIINEAAAQRAEEAGLKVIMDRCIKIDYWR